MGKAGRSGSGEVPQVVMTRGDESYGAWYRQALHALRAFLGISLALVLSFLLLGVLLYAVERSNAAWLRPLSDALSRHLFADSEVTGSFLDTVAGGYLTMTSIIITMLLLVLQQTASSMGNLIFDQFMARRRNKLYAGLIVGTLVLAILVRATVSESFNPVVSATLVLVVSVISIVLLLAFLYSTIEQMRPETIISDIHASTLHAREKQLSFVRRTRQEPRSSGKTVVELRSEANGYLVALDIDRLAASLADVGPDVELVLVAAPGTYVSHYDLLARVRAESASRAREVAEAVGGTFRFAVKRSMEQDPAYGLEQLEMLAWTEVSSAKQNPEVGVRVIHALRDLLSRWMVQGVEVKDEEPLPVVYVDDLMRGGLDVLESLSAVALESQEHQVLAEVLRAVNILFDRLTPDLRDRAEELVLRLLSYLDEQFLTRELDVALFQVAHTMEMLGEVETAEAIRDAREEQAAAFAFPADIVRRAEDLATGAAREPGFRGEDE
ncbi:MAG: DUF2254 domain-containing protein [Anaerolineaceae bacterium]|nr:DUF2254 domain-containing protein [Anaerolineaceae bacterium]